MWKAGASPPVWREVLADCETPLSAFRKIQKGSASFLLESVEGGEVWGRYSILAGDVRGELRFANGTGRMTGSRSMAITAREPLGALRETFGALRAAAPSMRDALPFAPPPPFRGGAVGWLAYDAVRHYARVPMPAARDGDADVDAVFLFPETWLVFDRLKSRIALVADTDWMRLAGATAADAWREAATRLDALEAQLARPLKTSAVRPARLSIGGFDVSDDEFARRVERSQEYIRAGDVIQVVLSRRREGTFAGDPLDVYRALRLVNPSPYMFHLRSGRTVFAGSSPEALVRVQNGTLTTRPIAGTRPRGRTPDEDAGLASELLADEKERAEHLMLVDLGRNDLGRVAEVGSVRVPSFMRLEKYSHVMHLVSDVEARLAAGKDAFDAVASVFPAGTLSGAPKVRAMQIVSELEGRRRGAYGGLVGWFDRDGNADTCIAIRTVEMQEAAKGGAPARFRVQAGAGVVYDSNPVSEARETAAKAEGVLQSLSLAARGLGFGKAPRGRAPRESARGARKRGAA